MLFTEDQIASKAIELHSKNCLTECDGEVVTHPGWREWAVAVLESEILDGQIPGQLPLF